MRFQKLLQLLSLAIVLLIGHSAFAQSVAGCGVGNQDSTCLTPLVRAPQAPPTCSAGAGWTTIAPAQWIGSGYTPPQCNYQAAPTCPGGQTQTNPPAWNGASWVGLACVPDAPSVPAGYAAAADGNPYARFLAYCAVVFEPDFNFGAGRLSPYIVDTTCTNSLAGASRARGITGMTYWATPSSVSMTADAGSTGLQSWNFAYMGAPFDFSANRYTLNQTGGLYRASPTYSVPSGSVAVWNGFDTGWFGEVETFVFACPSQYPNLNVATFNAYGDSNPALVECQP